MSDLYSSWGSASSSRNSVSGTIERGYLQYYPGQQFFTGPDGILRREPPANRPAEVKTISRMQKRQKSLQKSNFFESPTKTILIRKEIAAIRQH